MSLPSWDLPSSILFCRLCQSLYRQPRTLPCLHSFCHDCLRQLALSPHRPHPHGQQQRQQQEQKQQPTLACPICGQGAPLTSGGVSDFTSNEFLARMCREYVSEVQKTLVTSRQFPGQGPRSPPTTSVLAGRALPPAGGHFRFPGSPRSYSSSSSPSSTPSTSLAGPQTQTYSQQQGATPSSSSPLRSPASDYAFRGRHSSSGGGGAALQAQASATTALAAASSATPSPSAAHGFLSTTGGSSSSSSSSHMLMTPQRHSSSSSSSSSSDAVLQTARRLSSGGVPTRGVGVQRRLSSTPRDVVRTWECLQRKLNSLQAASLQATYSLETVNMAESHWHQRKQDLRRDVQRRSAQLQFFIKRQERLLLAALDSRNMDDGFNGAAEQARGELRANLKALMHETDVLKSVLDLATDSELMSLSGLLLGSAVSQSPVSMEAPELRFSVPEELSLEDMVSRDFGCLTSALVTHTIFTPGDIEQGVPEDPEEDDAFVADTLAVDASSTCDAASSAASDNFENGLEDMAYIDEEEEEEEEELVVEETFEIVDGKMQVVSKKVTPVSQTRYASQTRSSREKRDATKTAAVDSKDSSSRGRGTDIRRTANSSTAAHGSGEETTPKPARREAETAGGGKTPEDTNKKGTQPGTPPEGSEQQQQQQNIMEKFQTLRDSLRQKRRELLLNTNVFPLAGHPAMTHLSQREKRVQSLDRTTSLRDPNRRSPSPASPQRRLTPGAGPHLVRPRVRSSDSDDSVQSDRSGSGSGPGSGSGSTVVSTSITTSLVSPTDRSSRPVRRAISAASDRASKMEYLRETWRKRKELLIQNEAYFTAPHAKPEESHHDDGDGDTDEKAGPKNSSSSSEGQQQQQQQENDGDDAAARDHRSRIKQSIRTRISNLKQALKKNGKAEEGRLLLQQELRTPPEKAGSGQSQSAAGLTTPPSTAAVLSAEAKVLKTVENILQKKASGPEPAAKPSLPLQSNLTDTSPTLTSPGAKPSMLVKPRPREAPSPAVSPPAFAAAPLETLPEDGGKTTAPPVRKSGLRLTSPGRSDASKEKLQQVRANVRQKKERWRSLSLT